MASFQDYSLLRRWWKPEFPPAKGYTKSYQAKTPDGDILQADFHFHDRKIRLTLEAAGENGRIYVSTIRDGSILKETDLTTGRSYPLYSRFAPFRDLLSSLPDKDALQILGGAYGVSPEPLGGPERRTLKPWEISTKYDHIFGIDRNPRSWKRFFQREKKEPLWTRIKRRIWGDLQDYSLGLASALGIWYAYMDFYLLGFSLAVFGLLFGGLDWILRKRDPLFSKVVIFLGSGSYFYYYGFTRF
ncbi:MULTISPECIES: hypothetical protein [Leptospira]|uniref:Uncharacterized protein n=2 Tax=Leptospira TaxID=171 RepID=A0A4R9FNX1_9LEPT|nr:MULTISPECIES: hypothetical protein [Leptospira]TGK00436.1 hypothetical protein EHO58_18415 [Leptospira selangorensis]TGM17039.1 hypothetical protein EHQ81_00570 [Leptospira selangorensis]TGM21377.1 hypothetical protein EHQ82_10315 [Leptospira selangorensis]TGN04187.1 hypothetical protein EHR06_00445 [Leptospira dzoumogneensis]